MSSIQNISLVSLSFFMQTGSGIIFYLIIAKTLPVPEVGAITLFLSFGGGFHSSLCFEPRYRIYSFHFLYYGRDWEIFTSKVFSGNYYVYYGD